MNPERRQQIQLNTMEVFSARFEMRQTPRQALVMALKDQLRAEYDEYRWADNKTEYCEVVLDLCIIRYLSSVAGSWAKCWVYEPSPIGAEHKLSPFGGWIVRIIEYFGRISDQERQAIVAEARKLVG